MFYSLFFVQIKEMKQNMLISELESFLFFGQNLASCFPLFPVCMLSYVMYLLAVASYLMEICEIGIDLII